MYLPVLWKGPNWPSFLGQHMSAHALRGLRPMPGIMLLFLLSMLGASAGQAQRVWEMTCEDGTATH